MHQMLLKKTLSLMVLPWTSESVQVLTEVDGDLSDSSQVAVLAQVAVVVVAADVVVFDVDGDVVVAFASVVHEVSYTHHKSKVVFVLEVFQVSSCLDAWAEIVEVDQLASFEV